MKKKKNREKEKIKMGQRNYKKKTIGTKLITNTKKLQLKIYTRVWNFKNTMLKKRRKKKKNKVKIYIYEVCFKKKSVFFFFIQSNPL